MPTAWRIVKTRFASQAFDGEGARANGGRWNSVGVRMVYTSASIALAALELLVHLENTGVLPSYSMIEVNFDVSLVTQLDRSRLPATWQDSPPPPELFAIGDAWISGESSVVLEVPSAVIESEVNYLINPVHPNFKLLAIGRARPFRLDPRLFRS